MKTLKRYLTFFIPCLMMIMINTSCDEDLPIGDLPNSDPNTYLCGDIDVTFEPNIDTIEIFDRLNSISLTTNQPYVLGSFNYRIHKSVYTSGSDMMEVITYNGSPAILFTKASDGTYTTYQNSVMVSMPDLSEGFHPHTAGNNSLLAMGDYPIVEEVDLTDTTFLLVIEAENYQTGGFKNQEIWAMHFIKDELDHIIQGSDAIQDSIADIVTMELPVTESLYENHWSMIEIEIFPDCGGIISKDYGPGYVELL